MIKKLVLAGLVLSLPFAGCTDSNPPWFLTVRGEITETNDQYRYNGEVELGGSPANVTLTGVKVTYLDENQSQLGSDIIGNIAGLHVHDLSKNFTILPKYVIVEVDEINNSTDSNYEIEGAVVIEEKQGQYVLRNNYTDYNPVY